MGESEDSIDAVFYAINGSTGEMKPLGKGISIPKIPKLASGGIKIKEVFFEEPIEAKEFVIPIEPKTITKKRFIKLLMGKGYQRNDAYKMHEEYKKIHTCRTKLGAFIFEATYQKELTLILKRGDREWKKKIT